MAISDRARAANCFCAPGGFAVARRWLPSYRERFMGQQLRKIVKRRRRISYLARKKATAKAAAPVKRETPKPKAKAKKTAAAAPAAAE